MIKAIALAAALLGSTAALAQNSMDAGTANGSMSSDMPMSNDTMMSNDAMSNGTMSNGAMTGSTADAAPMAPMANADKCAKKYPSYDPTTGMYMSGKKQKKCMLK